MKFLLKYQTLIYGICLALALLFIKWIQLQYIYIDFNRELYLGLTAFFFLVLGVWLSKHLEFKGSQNNGLYNSNNHVSCGNEKYEDHKEGIISNQDILSQREMEILKLMAQGRSNQEIHETLFISMSTVKTHISNIFSKLDVKRRTQAVEVARSLGLL